MRAFLRKPAYLLAPLLGGAFASIGYFSSYSYLILFSLIAVCAGILLAFTDYSPVFKLLFLLIPVSSETVFGNGDSKILLPSEPVMIVLAIAFGIMLLFRIRIDWDFLKHPVSILVLIYLGIMAVTGLSSAIPVVSLKYALITFSYVFIFYFMAQDFIRKKESNMRAIFFFYGAGMLFVIIRAFYHHSTIGFHHEASGAVVRPYFVDHTMYSACLAMLFPVFMAFGFKGGLLGIPRYTRHTCAATAWILAVALFLSFSRAAWISVGASVLLFTMLLFRIKPKQVGLALFILLPVVWVNRTVIIEDLKLNRYSSTEKRFDLTEQTLSVGNISSDASNMERLNRWSCAVRMFQDKPLTGFGPGTYQFEYLSYQRPEEMTRISVTSAYDNVYGQGGSAHSEYLLALSEMGAGGFLAFTLIIIIVIACGMRAYYRAPDERTRLLMVMALTGFFTYAVHAFFNNFLNNNKPASLFWVLAAIIVLMDIKTRKTSRESPREIISGD